MDNQRIITLGIEKEQVDYCATARWSFYLLKIDWPMVLIKINIFL